MNYQEALDFLFDALPMYQRVGNSAFKKDLTNTLKLCEALGNPQKRFKSIHVAGTNGKGSSSHMIASVLQEAGYKTGLYTSPHLKSFTERVRINGEMISEDAVVDFVEQHQEVLESVKPSFFEMTVALAFDQFAKAQVDIAVIEVGLGGRLDSTNIITPEISLITNIGMDHMNMLGNTLTAIAGEKAGIVKQGIPVVIGESHAETTPVFNKVAEKMEAPIYYAERNASDNNYELDLKGTYQQKNLPGVLEVINQMNQQGWVIPEESIQSGLNSVVKNTGLQGRWQTLSKSPLTICDTGHNDDGVKMIVEQIKSQTYKQLHLVLGFVNDKDIESILSLFPADAHYIFCQPKVPRAMPLDELRQLQSVSRLNADFVADVNEALYNARQKAGEDDLIFVGGSTFVVAELNEL